MADCNTVRKLMQQFDVDKRCNECFSTLSDKEKYRRYRRDGESYRDFCLRSFETKSEDHNAGK